MKTIKSINLFSIYTKILISVFLLVFIATVSLYGQNVKLGIEDYNILLPEGIVHFTIDKSKITICFEDDVTNEQRAEFLKNSKGVFKRYQTDWEFLTESITIAQLDSGVTDESYFNTIKKIQQSSIIKYVAPVLTYKNEQMQALYNMLFVSLRKPTDIDTLKYYAKLYNLEIGQSEGQIIRCYVNKNSSGNSFEIAKHLQLLNLFNFAEPDFVYFCKQLTNDPYYNWQWYLNNTGSNYPGYNLSNIPSGNANASIHVVNAWQISPGGSSNIKVAVLDCFGSVAEFIHPDISFYSTYDATGTGFNSTGYKGDAHGINCAGIIKATGNNSQGLAGIAYNCKIIAVKIGTIYDTAGHWSATGNSISNGITWAYNNADVISNSNGFGSSNSLINTAISNSITIGRSGNGTPFFSATGNSNSSTIAYPASNTNTIAVGATSMCDQRKSPTSCDGENWGGNYGVGLDVSAPGVKIYTTDIAGESGSACGILPCVDYGNVPNGGNYNPSFHGTSAACPVAAGVMALIFSTNPNLTYQDARSILEVTCDKVGGYTYSYNGLQPNGTWSQDLGYGRINAEKAVYSALLTTSCPDYNDILIPTTSWQTDTKTLIDELWIIYKIHVTSGNTYTFKTGCGNGATANFETSLVLLDYDCNPITAATSICSNPSNTEVIDWTATYVGDVYLKVKASNWINGTYTLAYRYTSPVQTCTVSVSPSSKTVSYLAGTTTFLLTGSGNWTISESCPWITNISPSSGNGNATITITYLANGSLSSRSCTLTATCGSTTNNFTLNQNATSLTLSSPANETSGLSCSGINFSWSSNISNVKYRIQISTSNSWNASDGFNTTVYNQNLNSSSSFTWTEAHPNTTYYWCVKAYDVTNQVSTNYTAYRTLYTGSCSSSCSLPITSILGPTLAGLYFHHGCAGNDLVITWTAQSDCNVIEYELAFTNSSGQIQVSELFTQPSFTYPIENNYQYNADLFFIVRSRNAAGWGPYTPLNQLRIFACQNNSCNDPYEPNNSSNSSYLIQPVYFTNDEFYFKTDDACLDDAEDDWDDYYRIDLPSGYYYTVVSRLHDSWDSDDGITYTGDMEYRYFDGSDWSDYEDFQQPTFEVLDGGSLYFRVRPYSNTTGNDGTYSLEATIYRYLPNLKPYKPSGWDEPLIASISLGTHANSGSFTTADNIYIDACQIEDSDAPCGAYNTYIYVDESIVYNTNSAGLQPYDYEWVEDINVGPLSAGWHEIKMVVDYGLNIEESNENDNEYVKSIYVSPIYPDLLQYTPNGWSAPLVTSVTTGTNTDATTIYSTNNVYVDVAFSNISNQNITNSFVSYLYLNNSLVYTFNTPGLNANNYTYANDINIGQLQPGTYELKMIVDGNGQVIETNEGNNIYIKNFTVVCNIPSQPSSINGNTTVCQSSTQTYSVTNVSGVTYTWSVTGGAVISGQGTNSVNIVFTSSGAKTITVTPNINCGSGTSRTLTVIVTGFPAQPSVIVGNTSVCLGGGTQTYSVTNVGGVTYNWSVSGGTFTGSGNTIIVTWNTAGSQSIVVTPYNSCGNGTSRSLTVTINTTPASVNVSGGGTFCNGATLTAIGDNGSTIYWQGTTSNGTSTAIPLSSQTVTSSGTYYFRAFNSCGWGTQGSATVTINPPPVQPGVITGSTTVCKGQTSVTYSITNNPNATNYIWTTPNGTNIETSTPNSITINYSISAVSGNITVKDNNSCGDGPVSILPITVKSVPNEPVLLSENISFCSNEEKTINVSTTGDVSDYTWILPSNFNGFSITDSISITYSPIVQINNNSYLMEIVIPTIYVIANNICGSSTPLSIYPHIFQDTPLMGMIFGDTVICQGQSSITYTAPFIIDTTIHIMSSPINQDLIDYSNDTISYIWTLPNGWTGNSSTNSITCTPGLSGGTITLTAFNACGASIQRSIDVNVITVPPQPQTINGMTSVCPGSSQTYSIPSGSAIIPISLISENFNLIIDSNITDISSSLNSFTSTPNWTAYKIYQSNGKVKLGTSSVKGFIMTPSLDLSGNGGVFTIKFKARKWGNDQSQMKVIVNSTEYIVSELSSTVMSEFIIIASGGTALTTIIFEGFQDANSRFFIDDIDIIQNTDTYSYTWTFPSGWTQTSGGTTNSVTVTAGSGNGNITVTPSNSCGYGTARTLAVNTVGNNFSSLNLYTDQAATPNNELNVTTGQDTKFYIKVDACGDLNRRAQIQFQVYKDGVALTDLGQYLTDQYLSVSYFTEQIGINNPNPSNTYFNPFSIGTYPFANTAQFPPYNGYFVNWNTNAYNWFYMHFFNDRFITVDINAFSQPGQYSIIYNLVGANASCNITDNSTNYTAGLSYGGNGFQYCNNTFILASNTMTINVSGAPITEDFTIQTSSNPSIGGTTTGSGVFFGGSIRTVTATANSGYIFTNWTENGNVVSTDANYSFVLSNNRNLVANFICNLPLPGSVGLISGSSNVCQGDSFVTYSVPLIQNATSYIWALPNGATGTSTSNTITVNYGATATSGEISVKGINSCGEGPVSIREITVNSHPEAAGPISGNTLVCHGENLVLYSIPSIANATAYLWHFPDGEETTTLSNSIYLNYNALTVSGNITVRGINSCGEGIPSNIGVIINPLPSAAGVIIGDSIVCQGQSAITYTVPLIPNAESYVWTLPFGVIGSSTSNSITVNYEAYAISGNITVKGINTCGVGAISTKEIIVNALPAAAGIITGKATVCQGQNEITYTVPTITNAISYLWTLPNGATGSSITNSINVSYGTTAVSGNISIEGTNECGDGIVSIKAINVKPLPAAAGVISGNAIVCQGDSSVFYSIPNIPNATSYVWTLPDGAIGNSTTNSISVNYGTTAVSGYITVKGTNSCGEGIASNMSIFVNSLPDGVGIINGPSSPCENSIVAYSVNNQTTIYDDWFLPSKDELDSVRKKIYLFGLGGFGSGNGLYWTSTELDQNYALFHNFYWNSQQGEVKWNGQNMTFYPIRMFNSSTSYQLRDVGPAGGFIFHIENNQNNVNTYYEVSINSMTADWGCYGTSIGATGTAIGTGLSNTEAIVNGCPSLSNAARLCYDYSVTINNSVIWSVPLGWTIINGQGTNQIEVLVGSNNGTISVTPNNSCGKGDSSNLAINVNPLPVDAGTISGNATVCQGENSVTYTVPVIEYASSYIWTLPNGATGTSTTNSITVDYSTTAISGDISVKGSNACGEGEISTKSINIKQSTSSTINATVCDIYTSPDGQIYNTSGIKTAIIPNAVGCDSTITINLIVKQSSSSTINPTVCDTYTAPDGQVYTTSGIKTAIIPNVVGCDSTITINLAVKQSSSSTINTTVCDTYTAPDGQVYTTSGIKTAIIPNAVGCDSTITINLIVKQSSSSTINPTVCDTYTAPDGQVYTTSGIKTAIIPNAVGCDSTITINLSVNQSSSSTINATVCDTYTAPDGQVYTTSGTKTAIIPNAAGCDSTITINLTVKQSSSSTINATVCDTYTAPDGQVYTTSGTKTAIIPNAVGCDSTITINLTVKQSSSSTINATVCDTYTAPDGQVYTTSGTKTAIIPNAAGCDSTITINLSVNQSSSSTINATVCDTYTAPDGQVYTTSGTKTAIIPNVAGCDSTITINLTVKQSSSSTINATVCDTYSAPDGQVYTSSGTKTAIIPNAVGCDSTITINLTVKQSSFSTINETVCDTYTAPDGQVYTTSGTKTAIIPNAVGCDSTITINLTVKQSSSSTINATVCDTYTAPDGQVYTTSGTKTAIIPNAAGCDSTITINLTVNQSSSSTITEIACDSYTAPDGQVYTTSGTKTAIIPNAAGCDSTITINLTVKQSSSNTINATVCDTYTAPDGQVYTTSGTKTAIIPNAVGCDSTITINLTVKQSSFSTINVTVCDTYTAPDGQVYTTSGTKTAIIPNAAGCDSTITINLTVKTSSSSSINATVCDSYTAPDGQVYTTSGTKTAIISNAAGCDSTITINLTVKTSSTSTINATVCDSYIAPDGQVYTTSGTKTAIITNAIGCDSIITINLTVNQRTSSIINETACHSYTAPDGQVYTTSGTITAIIPNVAGCDSTITINLSVNQSSSSTISETVCDSYTAPDGQVYTTPGTKIAVIPNAAGCDSVITINLTVNYSLVTPTIVLYFDRLISSSLFGNQWYNQNGVIPNETNQELILTENGTYFVIVTQNNCPSDSSNLILVNNVKVQPFNNQFISISPNPFTNQLTIKNQSSESYQYFMYNGVGQLIFHGLLETEVVLNTSDLAKGLYIIKFVNSLGQVYYKVVKQ